MPRKGPLILSVPLSCAEGFAAMPRSKKGRHCASCAKVVTDFTNMTDREVTQYVRNHGFGCGIFRTDQLERPLLAPKKKAGWQRWAAALALLTGFANQSSGQQPIPPVLSVTPGEPGKTDTSKRKLTAEDLERLPASSPDQQLSTRAGNFSAHSSGGLVGAGGRSSSPLIVDGIVRYPTRRKSLIRRLLFWK